MRISDWSSDVCSSDLKLIYRVRNHIALWSHRIFYLARRTRRPGIYIRWARGMLMIYQGLTYSRGGVGKVFARIYETHVRTEARKKVSDVPCADYSRALGFSLGGSWGEGMMCFRFMNS